MADKVREGKVDSLTTKHQNLHGRRMTGAGDAVDEADYVTLRQLRAGVDKIPPSKSGGGNIYNSTTTITGGTPAPAAPNVTSVSATQDNFQFNGDPWFNFNISCGLPTTDPHYSELINMRLYVTEVATANGIAREMTRPAAGWGTSPYHFLFAIPTPTLNTTYHYEVRVVNSDGVETSPGVTGTLAVTAAESSTAPASGVLQFAAVNPLTVAETLANRYRAGDFTAHGILDVTVTLNANYGNQNVTIYYSPNNGSSWLWTNWYPISGTSVVIHLDKVVPLTTTNIKIAAVMGAFPGNPNILIGTLPSGWIASPSFSFTGIQAPSASAISTATLGTLLPLIDPDGTQDWGLSDVTFTDNNPVIDPYAKSWRLIVRIGSLSGSVFTAATGPDGGNDALIAQGDVNGATHVVGGIAYWGYPGDTSKTYAQFRLEVFNANGTATIQTCFTGVDSHYGYLNFGTGNGLLNAASLNPTKLGNGVIVSSGTLNSTQPNPSTSLLQDFDFSYSAALGSVPKKWLYSGSVTVSSSGGPNNCPFANLAGSFAFIQQGFPIASSQPLYFQIAARGHGLGTLTLTCQLYNSGGGLITSVAIGTVTGGAGSWSVTAISATVPASSISSTAVTARITAQTSAGGSDSWDLTQCIVRQTVQETNGGQINTGEPTTIPVSGGNTGFVIKSTTTNSIAYYGLNRIMILSPNGVNQIYIDINDTSGALQVSYGSGVTLRSIYLEAASGICRVSQQRGATISAGVDTTISGHTITGGIVTS